MPKKALILYGVISAGVMIAINDGRLSVFGGMVRFEIYLSIAGFLLILLGIFIGVQWISAQPGRHLRIDADNNANLWALSTRELEVLELMASGHTNQEIADLLFVSLPTIKTHSSNIYSKMHVKRRTQAVQEGIRTGLIMPHTKD
jgi:DNA-binding CsgD family transcriptional regulator